MVLVLSLSGDDGIVKTEVCLGQQDLPLLMTFSEDTDLSIVTLA